MEISAWNGDSRPISSYEEYREFMKFSFNIMTALNHIRRVVRCHQAGDWLYFTRREEMTSYNIVNEREFFGNGTFHFPCYMKLKVCHPTATCAMAAIVDDKTNNLRLIVNGDITRKVDNKLQELGYNTVDFGPIGGEVIAYWVLSFKGTWRIISNPKEDLKVLYRYVTTPFDCISPYLLNYCDNYDVIKYTELINNIFDVINSHDVFK